MNRRKFLLTAPLAASPFVAGCRRAVVREEGVQVPSQHYGQMHGVVTDYSLSFRPLMLERGNAYAFLMDLLSGCARNSTDNDQLVLGQISAGGRWLMWEGQPRQLRRSFESAAAFRQWAAAQAGDPYGSCVFESVVSMCDYIRACPGFGNGTKVGLWVLSDFINESRDEERWKARLLESLRVLGSQGAVVGFYFCDRDLKAYWTRTLRECGVRKAVVESDMSKPPSLVWE